MTNYGKGQSAEWVRSGEYGVKRAQGAIRNLRFIDGFSWFVIKRFLPRGLGISCLRSFSF
jgi:hypothetical protein